MIAILIKIAVWLLGRFITPPVPTSPLAQDIQEKVDEVQIQAAAAGDAVARTVDTDDKLRAYTTTDPNNRDNN
ncbi:hypothetical protein UFOVP1288_43 [uncultured Caudovirales phage]|uniref:Uncharacterized protein n=1 Tax=uncultured Caudovirales phage TaxID=2100421 RepID=A0A6J5RNJ2_9CAUD|nr:hypothetical protein UFOVP1195_43 [uncultured Caudovirales phage]CAB4195847.1 hypothetical protein UFOVP1288_43 [uncultured Caudovirales phage]CAB4205042.1 hypothetical protein UFOVP1409_43 [uncultured Caudovirales phage]